MAERNLTSIFHKNTFLLISMVIFVYIMAGCKKDENPATPPFTIESEINASKPYLLVVIINPSSGNWTFEKNSTSNNPFNDAYAENGFLIVVQNYGKKYFNLSLAKDIGISPYSTGSSITLGY